MKKIIILGLMLSSLCAFGKIDRDTKIANAEIPTQVMVMGSSATFRNSDVSSALLARELWPYYDKIVSMKVSNNYLKDIRFRSPICDPIKIGECTYADPGTEEHVPAEGIIFAYLFENAKSTESNKLYDCVLYANAEKIYTNTNAEFFFATYDNLESLDISILDTSKTAKFNMFFSDLGKLKNIDISTINTDNAIDMRGMFQRCTSLTSIDFTDFNTNKVEHMQGMFQGCNSLTELDLSSFNTSKVTEMWSMFEECNSLKKLNIHSFDTSNVTKMGTMFKNCKSLSEINVSKFDTTKVTDTYEMFMGCSSLTNLDISNFKTNNVTSMHDMFKDCSLLTELNLSKFTTSNVKNVSGMFNGCASLKKLDLSSFDLTHIGEGYKASLTDVLSNCTNLEYIKSPKALPADSATNSEHALTLPSQFNPYSGITALTTDNLADHPVINLPGDKFIYEWKNLRTEGEANGICAALPSTSTGNAKLKQLLADYKTFDAETKAYVDKEIDKEDVTIGESVEYFQNVIDGKQPVSGNYNGVKDDTGSFMTMSITEESPYLVAVISLVGILSVIGYYFYSKMRQAM